MVDILLIALSVFSNNFWFFGGGINFKSNFFIKHFFCKASLPNSFDQSRLLSFFKYFLCLCLWAAIFYLLDLVRLSNIYSLFKKSPPALIDSIFFPNLILPLPIPQFDFIIVLNFKFGLYFQFLLISIIWLSHFLWALFELYHIGSDLWFIIILDIFILIFIHWVEVHMFHNSLGS